MICRIVTNSPAASSSSILNLNEHWRGNLLISVIVLLFCMVNVCLELRVFFSALCCFVLCNYLAAGKFRLCTIRPYWFLSHTFIRIQFFFSVAVVERVQDWDIFTTSENVSIFKYKDKVIHEHFLDVQKYKLFKIENIPRAKWPISRLFTTVGHVLIFILWLKQSICEIANGFVFTKTGMIFFLNPENIRNNSTHVWTLTLYFIYNIFVRWKMSRALWNYTTFQSVMHFVNLCCSSLYSGTNRSQEFWRLGILFSIVIMEIQKGCAITSMHTWWENQV